MTIEDRARKYWDERINHSGDSLIRIVTNFATQEVKAERTRIANELEKICDGEFGASNTFPEVRGYINRLRNGGTE